MKDPEAVNSAKAAKKTVTRRPEPNMAGLRYSIGYTLRRAQMYAFQEFNRCMKEFDIRPTQYGVLVLLDSNPGLKQGEVSEALGIQKANFVGVFDALEQRGLAERRQEGSDRRSYALHLTQQGKVLVKKLRREHDRYEQRIMSTLGSEQSRQLLELLQKLQPPK